MLSRSSPWAGKERPGVTLVMSTLLCLNVCFGLDFPGLDLQLSSSPTQTAGPVFLGTLVPQRLRPALHPWEQLPPG